MAQGNDRDFGLSPEIVRLSAQLAKDPRSKLFIPLAEEYMKADMAEEAIMTLDEGLKVNPAYMSARVLLGKAYLLKGDVDKACEQFEHVIKAVPDNLFALRKLGEIYIAQGRREEALKNLRILAILSPKDEELNGLIAQLESGHLPPSPFVPREPESETELAIERPAAVQEESAPEFAAQEAVYGTPAEEEELEGAAPTFEIGEEEMGGLVFGTVPAEPEDTASAGKGFEPDIGAGVPEPVPHETSPIDLDVEIPYQPGDSEAVDLDAQFTPEAAGEAPAGFDMSLEEPAGVPPKPGEELQDIFASFGAGDEQEEPTESSQGVYELEETSGFDLEELGVKKVMTPTAPGEQTLPETPFEAAPFMSDDSGDLGVAIFGEDETSEVAPGEDIPFEFMAEDEPGEGTSPAETQEPGHEPGFAEAPFETSLDEEPAPFEMVAEETAAFEAEGLESAPFEMEDLDVAPFEAAEQFAAEEAGPFEDVPETGIEATAHAQEPFKTETLAEMYIKQGFYDRAIAIYKELLRESPGKLPLKQKLEELYMLAGMDSARASSERSTVEQIHVEPADFVREAVYEAAESETVEAVEFEMPRGAAASVGGEDVIRKLEQFLENVKRRGRQ